MQEQEKDFAAELKRRIEETDDPAKKRELEARLRRMEADVKGDVKGIPARRAPERQTAAREPGEGDRPSRVYVPGGGEVPKGPVENHGSPAFMNNDPKSNPDMEKDHDFDLGEPRANDGMHNTEQIYQGRSMSGEIHPDRLIPHKLGKEQDLEYDEEGNAHDRAEENRPDARPESEQGSANDGEASPERAKQAEAQSGPIDPAKLHQPTAKDAAKAGKPAPRVKQAGTSSVSPEGGKQ